MYSLVFDITAKALVLGLYKDKVCLKKVEEFMEFGQAEALAVRVKEVLDDEGIGFDEKHFYFRCSMVTYTKIATSCRFNNIKLEPVKKSGLPSLLFDYKNRVGLLIGLTCAILVVIFSGRFLWGIEVDGNVRMTDEAIKTILSENGIELSQETHTLFESLSSQGKTPLFFAFDNVYYGCIAVADIPKEDSKAAVSKLKELDITSVMITGDNEITAKAIAKSIGIDKVCASVTPEQKEEYVRKFREKYGVVAMCGDGINDSPALASADVGISLSKGTDIAIETADVILMHSDTYSVPRAIALSRSVISNIKLSLFWALLYNTLGIPIAAGVFYPLFGIELNPMIGAAAMSLSSICVVLNALRLKKFKFD